MPSDSATHASRDQARDLAFFECFCPRYWTRCPFQLLYYCDAQCNAMQDGYCRASRRQYNVSSATWVAEAGDHSSRTGRYSTTCRYSTRDREPIPWVSLLLRLREASLTNKLARHHQVRTWRGIGQHSSCRASGPATLLGEQSGATENSACQTESLQGAKSSTVLQRSAQPSHVQWYACQQRATWDAGGVEENFPRRAAARRAMIGRVHSHCATWRPCRVQSASPLSSHTCISSSTRCNQSQCC